MDEVSRLSGTKKIFSTLTGKNEESQIWFVYPERKSFDRMQKLVEKFSSPGELVVVLLTGTSGTAKACLEHLWYSHFVDCKGDTEWFAACTEAIVETNAKETLTEKSDI